MTLDSLNCPSCAAPLHVSERQTVALCVYCGSSIKIDAGGATPAPRVAGAITPEMLDQIKQLVLDDRRSDAIQLYQQQTGLGAAEAAEAVSNLSGQLTRRALLEQPIANRGLVLVAVLVATGCAAIVWGIANQSWAAMLIGAIAIVFQLGAFGQAIRVRYLLERGEAAPAAIQKVSRLGELPVRGQPQPVQILRLWLEARPRGRPAFHAEKNIATSLTNLAIFKPGVVIEVKYDARSGRVVPVVPTKVLES